MHYLCNSDCNLVCDYLFRKQFPALPMTAPVIPAWQLQQNSTDKSAEVDSAESRADTETSSTVLEIAENQTDTNPSLTVSAETSVVNHQITETVKDELENVQPEIVEVCMYVLSFLLRQNWRSTVTGRSVILSVVL